MITIIAEKPSVAREIARIVGAYEKADGYIHGNGYAVTWALGHLLEIWSEEGDDWGAELPVLPEVFSLRVIRRKNKNGVKEVDKACLKQLETIKKLFNKSEYIINAGDAGREGELIQRYIYAYTESSVPVKRLWISSLTDKAIREGLDKLRPSSEYDNLYLAGKARNEADWIVGVNATRALTKAVGLKQLSLGRVQTPLLAMVCRRYLEFISFKPEDFWTLMLSSCFSDKRFTVTGKERYKAYNLAYDDLEKVNEDGWLLVTEFERKEKKVSPPLLYDLTSLQKAANRKYGMSAQQTLNTAQSLYEKKLLTYPRTGSRFIPNDMFDTIPSLIKCLENHPSLGNEARLMKGRPLHRGCVNDTKITDHHGLLITENEPGGARTTLTEDEKRIYDMVATRLLESFSPVCEMITSLAKFSCAGIPFRASGSVVVSPGWKSIAHDKEKDNEKAENEDDDQKDLPIFKLGDRMKITSSGIKQGQTKPMPLYTEGSLVDAMEHAGREVEEDDLKDAIKECGLGTPATRAAEIETIIRRGYVYREKKSIVPTKLGLSVYENVKDKSIANVSMTASWEQSLSNIADGFYNADKFNEGIKRYASEIVSQIANNETLQEAVASSQVLKDVACPKCGGEVFFKEKYVECQNKDCGFKMWREAAGRKMSENDARALLVDGKTAELSGFKSKEGKPFSAILILKEDGKVGFEFRDKGTGPSGKKLCCPKCGNSAVILRAVAMCEDKEGCGWKVFRKVANRELTDKEMETLIRMGKTPVLSGFRSKEGKSFKAALKLDKEKNVKLDFTK